MTAPKYFVRCMSAKAGTKRHHIYLKPKKLRVKFTWGSLLRAAVYDSFEAAHADALTTKATAFQIVPVGYAGPPYWENSKHVRHDGSMAKYHNPRVFLIDPATGNRIEV